MTHRKLYRTPIPESSLRQSDEATRRDVTTLAGLSALPAVEATGTQADEVTLAGAYRAQYAERLATECRELLDADALSALPYYGVGGDIPDQAYVTANRVEGGRVSPQAPTAAHVRGTLVKEGTRATHRRAVHAGPTDARQVTHDFGTATTGYVGVPAAATTVMWLANDKGTQQTASADATVAAEFGDVELFDVEAAPDAVGSRPYLVYDLEYVAEGDVDAGVWDTYDSATKRDAGGTVAWGRVFKADHVARGALVLETGRLRTTVDTAAETLTAARWDDSAGQWSGVALGTADWVLADIDLVRIGAAHVRAQCLFRATAETTDRSEGDLYRLDAYWHRGWDDVQVAIPPGESGPVPSDLTAYLDPIASESVINPAPSRTLLAREDLRA